MTTKTSTYRKALWSLLGVILVLMVIIFYSWEWTDKRRNFQLNCSGSLILMHDKGARELSVKISNFNDEAVLIYEVIRDGKVAGGLRLTGKLVDWEPADLRYHFAMTNAQVLMDFAQAQLPLHVEMSIKHIHEALSLNESISIDIELLERKGNRVLIGFSKSESLLSCEM